MKKLGLSLIMVFLTGCVSANVENTYVLNDGSSEICKASYFSMFKDLTEAEIGACGSKGQANSSTTNNALGEILIRGLLAP